MISQKTYLSKGSMVLTLFVAVLMLGLALFLYLLDISLWPLSALVLVLLVESFVSALYFMPTGVRLTNEALTVVFPCRERDFFRSDIAEVSVFEKPRLLIRLCGSGAFCGWWGWFTTKGTGRFMMYAANLDHLLMIKLTNGKKYVISCGNPDAIINNLR